MDPQGIEGEAQQVLEGMMKLHEILTPDDPIVLELVQKRLDAGDTVTVYWSEHGRTSKGNVELVRPALSGDGYAIVYSYNDRDTGSRVSDKIFFRSADLENAKFAKNKSDSTSWTLDLRKA